MCVKIKDYFKNKLLSDSLTYALKVLSSSKVVFYPSQTGK